MQRLTAMTIGAALLGLGGFVYDASAQTSARCPSHESVVYFAPGSKALNEHSSYAIERMAEAAHACRANGVVVQAAAGPERANVVATALRQRGVKAVILPMPGLMPTGDTMVARLITLRVADRTNVAS